MVIRSLECYSYSRFGPLSKSIVDEIFEIVSHPWFHGDIARQEAQNLVESYAKPLGYVVRLSTSEPIQASPFTITKVGYL